MSLKLTFKALSDEYRRDILEMLRDGKMTAGDISARFEMKQATVSHHLAILKEAELVRTERKGKFIVYELNTSVFEDVMKWMISLGGNENSQERESDDERRRIEE
ncbi:autorepressor SdpR family transcription factor [Gorillibacterium timonense]|uniref:autorepressor SdpR family transcription factor n=1 Tax=Gorillibacterium timonense TaxID=1689269 RepID=UPI00071E4BAB|nr:autorepressor SdpR family transcription factor [Gorillibacterium timonense]